MFTMEDIMAASKQLTDEYIDLVDKELQPYLDTIDNLKIDANVAGTFEERMEIIDKMMALCKEMEHAQHEMMTNPEYMLKFFMMKMQG